MDSWRPGAVQTVSILRQQVDSTSVEPFNVDFPENRIMYSTKVLLNGTILIAQIFTALAAPSMARAPHDAEGESNPKRDDSFADEPKGLETQVKSEIDEQLEKRQV